MLETSSIYLSISIASSSLLIICWTGSTVRVYDYAERKCESIFDFWRMHTDTLHRESASSANNSSWHFSGNRWSRGATDLVAI
jgi:hypothetical protein